MDTITPTTRTDVSGDFTLDGIEFPGPFSFQCDDDSIGHLSFVDNSKEVVTIRALGKTKVNVERHKVEFYFTRIFA